MVAFRGMKLLLMGGKSFCLKGEERAGSKGIVVNIILFWVYI